MSAELPASSPPAADWVDGGEMGKVVRAMDWAKTPLGPLDSWPQSLRTTVSLCLASNFPISIAWGPGRVQIYNDGYWPICGAKHPASMGQDFKECWLSAWPVIGEAFEQATSGRVAFLENQRMFLDRHGYLEETFFTFSFSPIRDHTGRVAGLFHPVVELTQATLAQRRLTVLQDVADRSKDARTTAQVCRIIVDVLSAHALDLPFLLLYLVERDGQQARLFSATGFQPGSPAAPEVVDLALSSVWMLSEAARSGQIVEITGLEARLGPLGGRPYPESPTTAFTLPLHVPRVGHPLGLLVAGVSARRALDDPYRTFYTRLRDSVAAALSSPRACEHERARAEALAELDRARTALFSNVSHEFRTPLSLPLGPVSDALAGTNLDGRDREGLEATRVQGAEAGADDYLVNPLSARELSAPIEAYLQLKQLGQATQHQLRASEERYRQLMTCLPAAVYTCEASGVISFYNEQASVLWGRAPRLGDTDERFCGSFKLYWPDGRALPHEDTPMAIALREGRAFRNEEVMIERPDGTRITVRVNIDPIRDDEGRIVSAINTFHDTTALKVAEQSLRASEEQFRTLLNQAPMGVFLVDSDLRLREANPIAVPMFGDIPGLIGRDLDEVMHILWPKAYADELVERFRHTLASGESYVAAERIEQRLDRGSTEMYEWRLDRIRLSGEGGGYGVVCYFRDISAYARARATIAESEERFRALVTAITDVPWTTSAAGEFTELQSAWAAYTGQSWEEMRGLGWVDALHPEDRKGILTLWEAALRSRRAYQSEGRLWHAPSQSWRHFVARATPLLTSDGAVREWVGTCTDVHDQRLAQEALRESEQRLREANRVKDEFLATLSHELRTPLNAVLGWSRILRTDSLSAQTRQRAVESIEQNARVQAQLVDDLLDVSRIVSGKLEVKAEAVDLSRVILAATETVRLAAVAKQITLTSRIDADTMVHVTGDADRLQQVVWNLLTNAIKFSSAGGRVEVTLRPNGSMVEIVVTDSGQGIPPAFLPHVFETFRQADSTTARQHGGLGLGLAIVRHVVEAHGGTVAAHSGGEGQGAVFVVSLPANAGKPRDESGPVHPADPAAPTLSSARVLVIDDEADARDLLSTMLRARGAHVTAVSSAGEGFHALQRGSFNLILCDIGMPEQDGYSLIQAIRALSPEGGGKVPAVAVTAYATMRERDAAKNAGFDWHLAKPVDADELIALVATVVGASE